jgi:hypothetical protein
MPNVITARPDNGPVQTGAPTPVHDGGKLQAAWDWVQGNNLLLIAGLLLTVLLLVWISRRVRKIAKSEKPDEFLSNLAMVLGFAWSSEAIWELTGPGKAGLPLPIRVGIFAVLEVILGISMIRTKRNKREQNITGRSGRTVWIVAGSMALIASISAGGFAEGVLRLLIPLLLINQWWDGVVGEGHQRAAGPQSWRWTPRRLLLWLGAIEPGERDVETINRERVTQQMTRLYYLSLYGWTRLQARRRARLARLTLTADDAMIREVMRRVTRTSWTTAQPLAYAMAHANTATGATGGAPVTRTVDAIAGGPKQATRNRVTVPPARRAKPASQVVTSGDARDADPSTRAAQLYLDGTYDSIRKAADSVPGATDPTVRRRLKELDDAARDAGGAVPEARVVDVPMTQIPEPVAASVARVNGAQITKETQS